MLLQMALLLSSQWLSNIPCWVSLVAQWSRICLQYKRHRRHRFSPWARKIPWRRKWQPIPVFLPAESHGQQAWWTTVHKVPKSLTRLKQLSTCVQYYIVYVYHFFICSSAGGHFCCFHTWLL